MIVSFFILLAVYGLVVMIFFAGERHTATPIPARDTPLDDLEAGPSLSRHDLDVLRQLERQLSDTPSMR